MRQFAKRSAFDRAKGRRGLWLCRRSGPKRHYIRQSRVGGRWRRSRRRGGCISDCRFSIARFIGDCCRTVAERFLLTVYARIRVTVEIATDAESAITAKVAVTIEYGEPGKFDRQPQIGFLIGTHRPPKGNAAPGLASSYGAGHPIVQVELQRGGNFPPRPAEQRGARPGELDKFVRSDGETSIGVHVPDEAQWVAAVRHG